MADVAGLGCTSLEQLRELIGECGECCLATARSNIVFGAGNPDASVMFIGEAPGRNEDLKGVPFVGAAGKLLNELLAHAGLRRDDVYIANVLKCRPPGNRDPEAAEIDACAPFLREQIRLVDPQVLVTLGNFATRFVLKTRTGITALRGKPKCVGRFTVLPIFHPAAAIYDRTKRETLFQDFELLARLLENRPDNGCAAFEEVPEPQVGEGGPGPCSCQPQELYFLNRFVLRSASDEATQSLGAALGDALAAGDVLLLSGDLGAGKTRLTKGIARALGVSEPVTSPTFNMMLVHEGRLPLYHFDLYRLDEPSQLEELDYFGTIEADGVSVVEWGDRFSEARPRDGVIITLRIDGDDTRVIEASSLGERGDHLLAVLRQACGVVAGVSCEAASRQ